MSIAYNTPTDFNLQSPPYYHTASTFTFLCTAYRLPEPVRYTWTSTASSFRDQNSRRVQITNMDTSDEGVYTCSVTDGHGATTTIRTVLQLHGENVALDNEGAKVHNPRRLCLHACCVIILLESRYRLSR